MKVKFKYKAATINYGVLDQTDMYVISVQEYDKNCYMPDKSSSDENDAMIFDLKKAKDKKIIQSLIDDCSFFPNQEFEEEIPFNLGYNLVIVKV